MHKKKVSLVKRISPSFEGISRLPWDGIDYALVEYIGFQRKGSIIFTSLLILNHGTGPFPAICGAFRLDRYYEGLLKNHPERYGKCTN